jgi:hypothetical protein
MTNPPDNSSQPLAINRSERDALLKYDRARARALERLAKQLTIQAPEGSDRRVQTIGFLDADHQQVDWKQRDTHYGEGDVS